jgi:uncharacterized protein (TIGR02996 family)
MSDQLAFLQMIAEHPDDDVPRLVYADWLEETGEEIHIARAEFIRLQCHLEQLRKLPREELEQYADLWKRQQELIDQYVESWLGSLGKIYNPVGFVFDRGFLGELIVNDSFLYYAPVIESLHPILPKINLTIAVPHLDDLARCPTLRFVQNIHIHGERYYPQQGLESIEELLRSIYLTSMHSLDLRRCNLSLSSLELLGRTENIPTLKHLELPRFLANSAIVEFLASPLASQLESLQLYLQETDDQFFPGLLHSNRFTKLPKLHIHGGQLTISLHRALEEKYGEILVMG